VLDTYETERKPHARALIRLAKLIGTAMTEGGQLGNVLRGILAPRVHQLPWFADQVLSSETPALRRCDLVVRPRLRRSLAGRLCPNAPLEDSRRFDDVAGGRFALVTTANPVAALRAEVRQRGGVVVTARAGTELHHWLRRGHAKAAVVRPDGTVLRTGRDLPGLCAAMPAFGARTARPGKKP
jgi:3-(3-hydroxy-phenyl)propionate hydroxylase